MAKNIIICGHGGSNPSDPGAVANGINERDFIRQELAPRIKKYGGDEIDIFDMSKNCYQETQKGRGIQTLKGKNVIELHLDSAGPNSDGGHVIIAKGLSADAMDERIAAVVKKHFDWRHGQAFDLRDNLLNLNTAKRLGINYRLVEVCFITNASEVAHLTQNVDQIAKDFAEAITGKVTQAAAVTPAKQESKEEIKLYQPSNTAIKNATRTVLTRLVEKDPNGIDPSWVKKLDDGTLTESDATGLLFVAVERGLIQGTKE